MIEQKSPDGKASPEETRERIILAAREVIRGKGKRGATTREIADVAGVNEATLFRHFGNKEALIIEVARHTCPDLQIREFISNLEGPIEDDLLAIAYKMNEHIESMIDMIRWSLVEVDYENSVFARETWRPQLAMRSVIADYMERAIASGSLAGDPMDLAMTFSGMIFMRVIACEKFSDSRFFSDKDYGLSYIVNVFLNGVRSK